MDQKVMQILLILLVYQKIAFAEVKSVEEGQSEKIRCKVPSTGTIVFWFRVVGDSRMEFIGSFAPSGTLKVAGTNYNKNLKVEKSSDDFVLTVMSFNKQNDSGTYICGALVKGNELSFGQATSLGGQHKAPTKPPTIQVSTTSQTSTTPTNCLCKNKNKSGPSMFCAPIILGPLAGGCGLLLLLLIITILYCNKTRTRRCPHHYKRKPRMMAPEKQLMTNRHI